MSTHAIVDHLEIRPRKASVGLAWHCALVTPMRQKPKPRRLLPRPYVWLFGLTIVAIGSVLVAGAFAKALRWATL